MVTLVDEEIQNLTDEAVIERIKEHKARLGKELLILAHNYQRYEITELADYMGDSLAMAQRGKENKEAKHIVFCGVHFMAQTSRVLAGPHQHVYLPNHLAGCPLSDFADIDQAETAWEEIIEIIGEENIVPVAYINSTVLIKAICGKYGGTTVTSGNAEKVFKHYFDQGKRILFLPDEHLGHNTSLKLGVSREEMHVYDPNQKNGGLTREQIAGAQVLLWKGYCHVHTRFTPEMIQQMKQRYPDAIVIAHPECPEPVVRAADYAGSTHFINDFVQKAEKGTTIIIATEINHVRNVAIRNPHVNIIELERSLCPNMFKINLKNLLFTLENLGNVNEVFVKDDVKHDSLLALEKMFSIV